MIRGVLALTLSVCALGGDTPDIVTQMNLCTPKADPKIIRDVADGWSDDCRGLHWDGNTSANSTAETCKKECYADSSCSVWQFHEEKCYMGVPKTHCRARTDGQGSFVATAGQRVQHGSVAKLRDAVGMEVT